ncbi:MAG TPA: TRAFs-binding domain-containing protein [Thermoanaerobaculia bacterium]|nr:TRAFs-binding domain-containing protein [Thermoanaerobaculia bacterium]
MRPVCFMIMPYGERDTNVTADVGPPKVDFDALWSDVYEPVIQALGYQPVRADQDLGAVIIKDMIERLTLADLVLADITIANANVYYEVGVRHASAASGCVLLSAKWSKPVFDLAQIRHLQFALPSKKLTEPEAETLRKELVDAIGSHKNAPSPIYDLMPGYPPPKMSGASSFEQLVKSITDFQGQLKAARSIANKDEKKAKVRQLVLDYISSGTIISSLALELLPVVRDAAGWPDVLEYIARLPKELRDTPFVQEQYALAVSKTGNDQEAIAALRSLIDLRGESSERRGLLGGRFKKMYNKAVAAGQDDEAAQYLDEAIDHYTRGMYLDLNDFYSPSNLSRLLRTRGAEGDEQLAVTAAEVTRAGCERKLKLDPDDPWVGQTLLGQAADAQDLPTVKKLVSDIKRKRYPNWQIDTTGADLKMSISFIRDPDLRAQFEAALAPLNA